jgi:hypothetical protein
VPPQPETELSEIEVLAEKAKRIAKCFEVPHAETVTAQVVPLTHASLRTSVCTVEMVA